MAGWGCIAGGIAEACYTDMPDEIKHRVQERLTPDLWRVTDLFRAKYVG